MPPNKTGSVQRRGRRWHARWQDPTRHEHSATLDTKREADAWITRTVAKWRREHDNRGVGDVSADNADSTPGDVPTVAEYASIWRATLVDKAASTLARHDTALRCHILPAWGDHRLDEVTSLQVQLWLAKLVTTPLSRSGAPMAPAGATRTLRIFSGMLQAAAQTDDTWLKANPARGVRAPKEKTPERPFFTPEGLQRVADAIDPCYRALVLFAGYSGLRFAELTALQVRDINPLRGWVQIAAEPHRGRWQAGPGGHQVCSRPTPGRFASRDNRGHPAQP